MYLLDAKARPTLRRRLAQKHLALYSIGGLIFIVLGRFLASDAGLMAVGLAFYLAFATLAVIDSVSRKLKRYMALRYQLTTSYIRAWTEGNIDASQTIRWVDVTQFDITSKRSQSCVLLDTEKHGRLKIWDADLFTSDSDEPMLPIAAAFYAGSALGAGSSS